MGTKERREREREQLRGLILDAAREMFVERGYEGVSMRKIAEKIEYSPTAIYQHFKDKDALVREICRVDSQKLTEELKSSGAVEDPMERLMACGMAYARFAVENPNHYKMLFLSQLPAAAYEGDVAEFGKGEDFRPDALSRTFFGVGQVEQARVFSVPDIGRCMGDFWDRLLLRRSC